VTIIDQLKRNMLRNLAILVLCTPLMAQLPAAPSTLQRWDDRTFWATFGVSVTSQIYDNEMTHQGLAHHKCVENSDLDFNRHPSRASLYGISLVETTSIFAIGYLLHKGHLHFIPQGMFLGNAGIHFRAGTQWVTQCW
jgi:hypothetical protein